MKKYLFALLGVFLFGVIVSSTFAQVSLPNETFDLGTVDGVWNQTAQTLTIQAR